jgi:hypothetical protein
MSPDRSNGRDGPSGTANHDRNPRFGWLAAASLLVTLAVALVPIRLSWGVDTPIDLTVLFSALTATLWTAERIYVWRQKPSCRPPRGFARAVGLTIATVALLVSVVQPPDQAQYRIQCRFGTFGIWRGKVWIKAVPEDNQLGKPHQLLVLWGPWCARYRAILYRPTYFVMNKQDWTSPEADIVEPAATLSCGTGSPPLGADRQDLTGPGIWHRGRSC